MPKTNKSFGTTCVLKRLHIPNQSQEKGAFGKPEWNDWLGELEDIECFDNEFLKSLLKRQNYGPQQRLILETSYEALEDAGMIPGLEEERNIEYTRVSVPIHTTSFLQGILKNTVQRSFTLIHGWQYA